MRIPTIKQLESMSEENASATLEAFERDLLAVYDNATLWHRRGIGYARKLTRAQLKRIERARSHLGIESPFENEL